jgi:hypothetical protein
MSHGTSVVKLLATRTAPHTAGQVNSTGGSPFCVIYREPVEG